MLNSMDEERLAWDLQFAPSIKLLKADHAALIISFLYRQFKSAQRLSLPLPELVEQLEGYLEYMNEREPGRYARTAQTYITEWADEKHQFIRISAYGGGDAPLVELTADTERTISWLEEMHTQQFVGTESRFLIIFQLIRDLVQKSTEDPSIRLAQLEQERDEIEQRIAAIRQTGLVDQRYTKVQLRERFFEASRLARQLLRDFRLVEDRFRAIARSIQEAQLRPGMRKGRLVEYVLDADTELKSSDQGKSFYSFWEFLMAPSQADELKLLLEELETLPDLQSALEQDHLLSRLPGYLVMAGEKIVQSNSRLAEQLRRLLDEQVQAENRRVYNLLQEIKQMAYHLGDTVSNGTAIIELEDSPDPQLVMERTLWEPDKTQAFRSQPFHIDKEELDETDLSGLYAQFYVDETLLQRRIEALLEHQAQVMLSDIVARYPIEKGLAEVVAYYALAGRDPRHVIDPIQQEEIVLPPLAGDAHQRAHVLLVPQIRFQRGAYAK